MTRWERFVKWMGSDILASAVLILCLVTIMWLIAQAVRFLLY